MEAQKVVDFGMTVASAAAVTSILLWMFQESADMPPVQVEREAKKSAKETLSPTIIKPATVKKIDEEKEKIEGPLVDAGLEKIGDASVLLPDYIQGLNKLAQNAAQKKHGCGFFDNWGQPFVILTKPEHISKCLTQHVSHELGGMRAASAAFFGEKVLFILEDKEWRQLRNTMVHSFLPKSLPLMATDVTFEALKLCNRLGDLADGSTPVDIHFFFAMYHLSAIGKAAFNYDLGCISKVHDGPNQITEAFEFLLRELPRRAYAQDVAVREDYETPRPENIEWKKHANAVRGVVNAAVEARLKERAQRSNDRRHDLLESMIQSYEKTTGLAQGASQLTDALGDNLVEILFAGYNTSVAVLANAIYFVAKNPNIQQRLQQEADTVLSDLPLGKAVDVSKLPLCEAVFLESLRLVPPAPLLYRSTRTATVLDEKDNLTIPSGSSIWIPAQFVQTDPATWGSDASEFNPDRWLGKTPPHPPGAFVPFSSGPRECLGRYFAKLESVTALGLLFKNFDFSLADGYQFCPTFTGFGLRPFDQSSQKVSVNVLVNERTLTADSLFDWSPAKPARKKAS